MSKIREFMKFHMSKWQGTRIGKIEFFEMNWCLRLQVSQDFKWLRILGMGNYAGPSIFNFVVLLVVCYLKC